MKVLLVDDDPIGLAWLRQVLSPFAREVLLARNGMQAWALLRGGFRPDACLCELRMQGMDGLQLLGKVRTDPVLDDLPFVLVSAAADRDAVQEAAAVRASAYMLKPHLVSQARGVLAAAVLACRRARCEHFAETMRRLRVDREGLERRLRLLSSAIGDSADSPAPEDLAETRAQAAVLGLHRCAGLLDPELVQAHPAAVRRECVALVADQLAELSTEHRVLDVEPIVTSPAPLQPDHAPGRVRERPPEDRQGCLKAD